jgi:hypothetical protein
VSELRLHDQLNTIIRLLQVIAGLLAVTFVRGCG